MSDLSDKVHEWEIDLTLMLSEVVEQEDGDELLVDVDEVAFLGALPQLPDELRYLDECGFAAAALPEVYVIGIKDGMLIAPEIWMPPRHRSHSRPLTLNRSIWVYYERF